MWKSTTTTTSAAEAASKVPAVTETEDDWETDPNFVNEASEKDQRWGNGKNQTSVDMNELRRDVIQNNETTSKKQWEIQNGKDVKSSYGVKK